MRTVFEGCEALVLYLKLEGLREWTWIVENVHTRHVHDSHPVMAPDTGLRNLGSNCAVDPDARLLDFNQ